MITLPDLIAAMEAYGRTRDEQKHGREARMTRLAQVLRRCEPWRLDQLVDELDSELGRIIGDALDDAGAP